MSGQDRFPSRAYLTVPPVRRFDKQLTGLVCCVEAFQVSMATEEHPAQMIDFPDLPSANTPCALRISPSKIIESKLDDYL